MKKTISIISLIVITITAVYYSSQSAISAEWHMINVSNDDLQGDANLLINGWSITMIDAGYSSEAKREVIPYLKKLNINKIHHFFISHPHKDHYQGMEAIQNASITIDNVYYSMPSDGLNDCCYDKSHFIRYLNAAENRGAILHDIGQGFNLNFPNGSSIEVLHAHKSNNVNGRVIDANDASLIMKWNVGRFSTLFTGDLNSKVGAYLAGDDRMSSDILKVPHHGGRGIARNAFFDQVNPALNMVPGPAWVWNGERGNQARTWSQKKGIQHCVNGINGNVKVVIKNEIMVTAQRPNSHCINGNPLINNNPYNSEKINTLSTQ